MGIVPVKKLLFRRRSFKFISVDISLGIDEFSLFSNMFTDVSEVRVDIALGMDPDNMLVDKPNCVSDVSAEISLEIEPLNLFCDIPRIDNLLSENSSTGMVFDSRFLLKSKEVREFRRDDI